MRKGILIASMISLLVLSATAALAEVSVQFRLPMQITENNDLQFISGQSILFTVDAKNNMTVGLLEETINFTDKIAATPHNYSVTAFRISKTILAPVAIGVDFGMVTCDMNTTSPTKNVADFFANVNILSAQNKAGAFLNVEILYRFLNNNLGTAVHDFSGAMANIGAGIHF